ncbi:TlyA family RNA methyltransferase [Candidatus Saccharibacteria bacterium]|nr:TlyA family RNA methyltransferase [Candidatus Saccharibacteria bacterium]
MKHRLDQHIFKIGLAESRSQAENFIKLGEVKVNGRVIKKTGYFVDEGDDIKVTAGERYVSRAGLKLASVAQEFGLDFKDKIVLDVGSSTGGFTDYALQHGAKKVTAVDVGTNQLHPKLRGEERIDLREQTDIREIANLSQFPDIVVIDVSFISLKEVLPSVAKLSSKNTKIAAMLKPQFEAGDNSKHKGVIKNERMRRDILKNFEEWAKERFVILDKSDSKVHGAKGNQERFYVLKKQR